MLSHVSSGASYTEYLLFVVSKRLKRTRTWNVADLRVIEHPKEPCEIFTLDVFESVGVMVRGTAFFIVVGVRAVELLTEKQRLALEEITMYPVEVIFDLRTHVSAQLGGQGKCRD